MKGGTKQAKQSTPKPSQAKSTEAALAKLKFDRGWGPLVARPNAATAKTKKRGLWDSIETKQRRHEA